ncbi:uncharacterized protein EAE98_003920 [Botrytis deweyae]|uniref:Uncharacterized protein n=1 Tax=Botrytis deweyae TaxID=2478750 RepID=A0ABQ7IS61_9HELO|nr:uncharacterized protein EAE98_003920 [Botrytis deweyae]KAF7932621.1 hypothetical protein EAE98_003920 [Botrytis deweyae]
MKSQSILELSAFFELLLMGSSPISAQSKIYGTVAGVSSIHGWAQRYFVADEIPHVEFEDAKLLRISEDISAN